VHERPDAAAATQVPVRGIAHRAWQYPALCEQW